MYLAREYLTLQDVRLVVLFLKSSSADTPEIFKCRNFLMLTLSAVFLLPSRGHVSLNTHVALALLFNFPSSPDQAYFDD